MTFKNIIDGKELTDDLAIFIKSDMDKWSKVAFRELALEEVRARYYPNYPSRMACLYTSSDLKSALNWAQFFKDIGRDVFSLVKLKVEGKTFTGDACNCFDGTENETENLDQAKNYWSMNTKNPKPVMETLVAGKM